MDEHQANVPLRVYHHAVHLGQPLETVLKYWPNKFLEDEEMVITCQPITP